MTELLLDLASEEEVGFTEELDSFAFSSDELEFLEPLEDEDWRSPLEAGMTEEEEGSDFSTEEEEPSLSFWRLEEPIESTELLLWIALSPLLLEISATGSEDAALVLSSQAIKNPIKREIAAHFALAMAFFLFKLIWASVE